MIDPFELDAMRGGDSIGRQAGIIGDRPKVQKKYQIALGVL